MQLGEFVIGKRSRGWLVAISRCYVIYADKTGLEFVELIGNVSPSLCDQCDKLKVVNDRPWRYLNGALARHSRCGGCKKVRFEKQEPGWRTWHLKKCPGCRKNPRRGDSMMRPSMRRPRKRKATAGRVFSRPMLQSSRPSRVCSRCRQWRKHGYR